MQVGLDREGAEEQTRKAKETVNLAIVWAQFCEERADWAEAVKWHRKVAALSPESRAAALEYVGDICRTKMKPPLLTEAEASYRAATEAKPDEFGPHGELVRTLCVLGRGKAEIDEMIAAAARAREDRSRGLVSQADAAAGKRNLAIAVKLFDEGLALGNDDAVRARRDAAQKKLDEERKLAGLLKIVGSADPRKTADAAALGRALEAAKEAAKHAGEEEAKRLRAVAESLASAIEYRRAMAEATAAAKRGKWKAAKEAAQHALVKRPGDEAADAVLARASEALKPRPVPVRKEEPPKVLTNGIGMRLVRVPAGEFQMGSDAGEDDERPVHAVRLGAFWIGITEVTNAQYELFRPEHASERGKYSTADECPVVRVTWFDAIEFCGWLSEREGQRYMLPTEAEWEYAARGTGRRIHPWGNEWQAARANAKGAGDEYGGSAPVGSFPEGKSPFGVLDCAGNVWEWCVDWYGGSYYAESPREKPGGPPDGEGRVTRGGSWFNEPAALRATNRAPMKPTKANATIGFRVVKEVFEK